MNKTRISVIVFLFSILAVRLFSTPLESYLDEAKKLRTDEKIDESIALMEKAVVEYPDRSEPWNLLGELVGDRIQKERSFTAMFSNLGRAFACWDRALEIDPNNFAARFNRGAWAVNVPKSVGQLDKGVEDLKIIVNMLGKSPDPQSAQNLIGASSLLAKGLQKQGDYEQAKAIWMSIIKMAPGSEPAKSAQDNVAGIERVLAWLGEREKNLKPVTPDMTELEKRAATENADPVLVSKLAQAYMERGDYHAAEKTLRSALITQPNHVEYLIQLVAVLSADAQVGYDPRIYLDTDLRTDLAFEVVNILDRAVALSPDDMELRLSRAGACVNMPFFVGKLDSGIEDLQKIIAQDVSPDIKSEALYLLGFAYQKKANTQWTNVISTYPESEASKQVFDILRPSVERLTGEIKPPLVTVDFILGFKDELAPQTAVWVQDGSGNFVKTIYVSGFSGFAREKQTNLPIWAGVSKFADADAVTGASIDLGHHLYHWNLRNVNGQIVKNGAYVVCIEVSFWPTMQYQRVEVPITIGKKSSQVVHKEGNLIPYVEVTIKR